MTGIYIIRQRETGQCYVGQSLNIARRWIGHRESLAANRASRHLQRAWNKHGESAFDFVVVEQCDPETLCAREQFWIDSLTSDYNIAKVAGSRAGVPQSASARAKASAALIGRPKGPMSAETKSKLRAANLGRSPTNKGVSPTAEQRAKRLANQPSAKGKPRPYMLGRRHSDETRAKMRGRQPAWTGKRRPAEIGAKISATKKARRLAREAA